MDPSEINNFEEQWRKALSEASETPPKSIWENIEARLDENNEKQVLPLWWQSKKLWLAAASVAALLVVGAGLWFSDSANNGQNGVEVAIGKNTQSPASDKLNAPETGNAAEQESSEATASNSKTSDEAPDNNILAEEKSDALAANSTFRQNAGNSDAASSASRVNRDKAIAASGKSVVPLVENNAPALNQADAQNNVPASIPTIPLNGNQNEILVKAETSEPAIQVDMLAARGYNDLDINVQKRYIFYKPNVIAEEEIQPKKHTEYWAGIGLMPASFNPDVQLKNAPQDFSYQALSSRKAVTASSEAGVSYALQTHGGVRISKHWSVELGLSYLQGNSSYEGGGYLINSKSQSTNVLENALIDASPRPSYAATDKFNNGALYVDITNKVSNNYQYLQMPLQAGFTLNPDKKLSYSLLGGMMANFFLSNEVEAASGDIITTKASDEIYRSVNWAATTGLRFNYRLSSRWKANLTGSYQKAISSGFRSNQTLDAHPYLYGVAWGVRYSF